MAHRRFEEEEDEFAATVLMKDVRAVLGEDALTPRAAPRREHEEAGRLIVPEPDIPPAPIVQPAPRPVPSFNGPPPVDVSLRGRAPVLRQPPMVKRPVRPAVRSNPEPAWLVAAGAVAMVVVAFGAWALL